MRRRRGLRTGPRPGSTRNPGPAARPHPAHLPLGLHGEGRALPPAFSIRAQLLLPPAASPLGDTSSALDCWRGRLLAPCGSRPSFNQIHTGQVLPGHPAAPDAGVRQDPESSGPSLRGPLPAPSRPSRGSLAHLHHACPSALLPSGPTARSRGWCPPHLHGHLCTSSMALLGRPHPGSWRGTPSPSHSTPLPGRPLTDPRPQEPGAAGADEAACVAYCCGLAAQRAADQHAVGIPQVFPQ